jgi:uncharacterized membrane protein YhhN
MTVRRSSVLLIIGLIAAVLFIADVGHAVVWLRVILKSIPLVCLIGWVVTVTHDRYAMLILAGLLFCLAGDVLLEISDDLFVPGLVAFLIGHVWYITAFLTATRALKPIRLLIFAVWVIAAYLILLPNLKDMALPVAAYVIVIGAMMWRASARVGAGGRSTPDQWAALIGAILFGLSDTLLALGKFNGVLIGPSFTVIVLYWLGQSGIALSVKHEDTDHVSP